MPGHCLGTRSQTESERSKQKLKLELLRGSRPKLESLPVSVVVHQHLVRPRLYVLWNCCAENSHAATPAVSPGPLHEGRADRSDKGLGSRLDKPNSDRGTFVDDQIQDVAWLHQDVQEQAPDFLRFFLLSQLSEPGRLGTALCGPASRLASTMTFSGCDTSPTVDCCHFQFVERRVKRNLEGLANVRLDELTVVRCLWLFFIFAYAEEERTWREGRQNSPLASQ